MEESEEAAESSTDVYGCGFALAPTTTYTGIM
jgi:hypothetical protein